MRCQGEGGAEIRENHRRWSGDGSAPLASHSLFSLIDCVRDTRCVRRTASGNKLQEGVQRFRAQREWNLQGIRGGPGSPEGSRQEGCPYPWKRLVVVWKRCCMKRTWRKVDGACLSAQKSEHRASSAVVAVVAGGAAGATAVVAPA